MTKNPTLHFTDLRPTCLPAHLFPTTVPPDLPPAPSHRIHRSTSLKSKKLVQSAWLPPTICNQPMTRTYRSRCARVLKRFIKRTSGAHEKALKSGSELVNYNSTILRTLEGAFAANPEADLLSNFPSRYSAVTSRRWADALAAAEGIRRIHASFSILFGLISLYRTTR